MAKIKLGAVVVDISGKLGGHVFARNRGGNYMRTKVSPLNPQTSFQTAVRSLFASITSSWSSLTEAQRATFNGKVGEYARTNIFGDLKNPTGKALFQQLNQNLALTNQTLLTICPNPGTVPAFGFESFIADVVGPSITVKSETDTTGYSYMVYVTPVVSNGTLFIKNKLRLIKVGAGSNGVIVDISSEYAARFGSFIEGDKIFVATRICNSQGQVSPLEINSTFVIDSV